MAFLCCVGHTGISCVDILDRSLANMKLPEELQFIENARLPQKTTEARMDGKLCVLTGATSGVGYQAARRLAQGGASLVLVCRNLHAAAQVQAELRHTYGTQVDVLQVDFSRLAEVRSAAAMLLT